MLSDAAEIVWEIESLLSEPLPTLFILGDTAFGEASVDEAIFVCCIIKHTFAVNISALIGTAKTSD